MCVATHSRLDTHNKTVDVYNTIQPTVSDSSELLRMNAVRRAAVTLRNTLDFQRELQHQAQRRTRLFVCLRTCAWASLTAVVQRRPCQTWYVSAPPWDVLRVWFIVQIGSPSIVIRYGSVLQGERDASTHSTDFWWKVQTGAITLLRTNKHNAKTHSHTPTHVLARDDTVGRFFVEGVNGRINAFQPVVCTPSLHPTQQALKQWEIKYRRVKITVKDGEGGCESAVSTQTEKVSHEGLSTRLVNTQKPFWVSVIFEAWRVEDCPWNADERIKIGNDWKKQKIIYKSDVQWFLSSRQMFCQQTNTLKSNLEQSKWILTWRCWCVQHQSNVWTHLVVQLNEKVWNTQPEI